jgi:hypothetical protein
MSYLPQSELEKQQQKQQEDLSNQPQQLSAGAPVEINQAAGTNSANTAQVKAPGKSGSYTNLQSYLNANKEQGQKLVTDTVTKIEDSAKAAQQGVQSASNAFNTAVQGSVVKGNDSLLDEAVNDSVNFVKDANKVYQLNTIKNAEYKGPKDLLELDDGINAQKQVQKAQGELEQGTSEAGRYGLINSYFSRPQYSQGQQKLDQLLLQNTEGTAGTFDKLKDQYKGLGTDLDNAVTSARAASEKGKADTQTARNAVTSKLGQATGDFETGLNARVAEVNKAQDDSYKSLFADLEDGIPSSNNIDALGLRTNDKLWKVNINSPEYVNKAQSADVSSVATADDYAKYSALAQLAGVDPTLLSDANISRAGTASSTGYSVNKEALRQALTQQQAAYEAAAAPVLAKIAQMKAQNMPDYTGLGQKLQNELKAVQNKYGYSNIVKALNPGRLAGPQLIRS